MERISDLKGVNGNEIWWKRVNFDLIKNIIFIYQLQSLLNYELRVVELRNWMEQIYESYILIWIDVH